ncbi:KAP family P-loop NTPase fold protein [Kibdelosporangium phytohabitans]|uniref:KAP family P-loop NTPase fold protein n=1 Tax=Kibdelosporangium phytohabitans TaxID=860235 RepID=UPI0014700F0F|nr:P-loop NTPase fold protein [Kibdelosporangium phytohabitans]
MTDNPITGRGDDQFGFGAHSRVLCDAIQAAVHLPLTVGVFGPWGTGKSSFLNICREMLDRRGIPTIAFNPWKYDEKEAIWHALIQTILTEIAGEPDGRRHELVSSLKHLSSTATWLLMRRVTGPLTAGLVNGDDLVAARDAWQTKGVENYRHINHFEADFAELVRSFVGDQGRLVVFVDDLDRCHGDTAIAVLDALKLFLGEASCVFVLAMDSDVISAAAAKRVDGDHARGRQFLEKLIHFPYHLPEVRFEAVFRQLQDSVVAELSGDPALWQLAEEAFGENPRRIRRFVSALNLTAATLRLHSQPSRDRLMQTAILLALRMRFPDSSGGSKRIRRYGYGWTRPLAPRTTPGYARTRWNWPRPNPRCRTSC